MSKFVHLHVHTDHSTLDGINRIDKLPEHIKTLDQDSIAITDHGTMSGTYKFVKECRKAKIKPICGIEAYYTVNDRAVRERDELNQPYYHLVLLAQNGIGLKNLFKLSSRAYTEGRYFKPRVDDELLAEYSEGIYATSSCLGSRASQLILNNRTHEAERLLDHHASMFPDRFLIELQLHKGEQEIVNKVLMGIAKRRSWPLVLTNDTHYTLPEDKILHEQALCMQTGAVMSNPKRFSFGDIDVHLASHNWMWKKAQAMGIPYEAISNTVHIANNIQADEYFDDTKNRYPTYKGLPEGLTSWDALERLAKHCLVEKIGGIPPQTYIDRMNYELKIIKKMGFSNYMLIDWEIIQAAKKLGVNSGFGRGSAAGSLVSYALDITKIDPIKYGLVFERFLSVGRSAKPIIFDKKMKAMVEAAKGMPQSTSQHCHHNPTTPCTEQPYASLDQNKYDSTKGNGRNQKTNPYDRYRRTPHKPRS